MPRSAGGKGTAIKIMVFAGTRPEVIKMAPVMFELKRYPDIESFLVSSGQHETMLDQMLGSFNLSPNIRLRMMRSNQELSCLTSRLLKSVGDILRERKPDIVLVQGDTTTVLSTALSAFYERVPVGHVEAGLRTHSYESPWPEEMNRRLTDAISHWCFAPTAASGNNLIREGIEESRIFVTGNTIIDALVWMRNKMRARAPELPSTLQEFVAQHRIILVTAHRRESFGKPIRSICRAILQIADSYEDVGFVYPVHLNPQVREAVSSILDKHPRILLTDPLDYESFIWLMDRCYYILTDSGGVQEEATAFGKPTLVTRGTTERPEGVDAGVVRLVGTEAENVVKESAALLDDPIEYGRRSRTTFPYGEGNASREIVNIILNSIL